MRNRRMLILIGLVVVVAGLAIAFLFLRPGGGETEPPPEESTPEPTTTLIVLSAQNIARGQTISTDAVILQNWPIDAVPPGALTELEAAYDQVARTDIPRGMPVVESMLGEIAVGEGSEASMQIPEGRVAYALPVSRYSSVAWAIRAGDHVDVLMSVLLVDIDEEFQSVLPNNASCAGLILGEGETCQEGLLGRLEVLPTGQVVSVVPSEAQRPRPVTQLTVQDAVVLRVGDWPQAALPTPVPDAAAQQAPSADAEEAAAAPTPVPTELALTIAVTHQEAEVLEFALMNNARITFVLRPVRDTERVSTSPVTVQYLLDRYGIQVPPKLPYGFTPPIIVPNTPEPVPTAAPQ